MYCPYCGAEIIDEAVFCSKCGKRIKKEKTEEMKFQIPASSAAGNGRWTAETELGVIEPFSMPVASLILERIAEGRYQYLILTPPSLIHGCRFLQFCSDDNGKIHAEIAMAKGEDGTVIKAANAVGIRDAVLMIEKFMRGELPSFPANTRWTVL